VPHPENDVAPALYGVHKLTTMLARWNGSAGQYVRQFSPQVFPGAPPEALMALSTIGGQTEDTCDNTPGQSFHELGLYQTEGGPCSGPGPNPDPYAPDNNWGRLANSSVVTSLLGRPATMVDGAWRQAVDDQTAVGLANVAAHAASVASQLSDPSLAPTDPGGTWNIFLGLTGFSAGDSGAARTVNRYAAQLAGVDERARVAALIDAILVDAQNGTLPGSTLGDHGSPAYDALRSLQKLAAGRALAQQTGGDVGWFDYGFGDQQDAATAAIDDAAYGRTPTVVPSYTTPAGPWWSWLLPAALAAAAAVAAYLAWQQGALAAVGLPPPRGARRAYRNPSRYRRRRARRR
jgi:hypothetical protein